MGVFRRLVGVFRRVRHRFDGRDTEAELAELKEAVPLGYAKFLRYENDQALFVCVDARANVHRIELDREWIRVTGVATACNVVAEAVQSAGASLSAARRN